MSDKPIIHLCILQLLQPLELWHRDFRFEAKAPQLSLLLRQFKSVENKAVQGLDASLFNAIGSTITAELPVAHYRFQTHENTPTIKEKLLLCADPIHLEVGMNDITLTEIITDLSKAEAQEMLDELNVHFKQDGLEFILGSNQHWYLLVPQNETLETTPLGEVLRKNVAKFQPHSNATNPTINWQVIQNEAQMILHASAVNQQREMAGLTTANSLWFWGAGNPDSFETVDKGDENVNAVFCNQHSVISAQTIAKAAGCEWQILPDDLNKFPNFKAGKNIIILDQLYLPAVHDDLERYQQVLSALDEQIIKPLQTAWQAGQIELLIDGCDGNVIQPQKVSAWQFWKHTPPLLHGVQKWGGV